MKSFFKQHRSGFYVEFTPWMWHFGICAFPLNGPVYNGWTFGLNLGPITLGWETP